MTSEQMLAASLLWLIPFFPLLGFALTGLMALVSSSGPQGASKKLVTTFAVIMPALSFAITCFAVATIGLREEYAGQGTVLHAMLGDWIHAGHIEVGAGLLFDRLSSTMLLFITGIGTLIVLYSSGYMSSDRGYARFMSYLNLFLFSMIILVLSDNLILTFLGWEGVGVCSYLLIGFWHNKHENNDAARKAFIVNRVGDLGLLLGVFCLMAAMGDQLSFNYSEISAYFRNLAEADNAQALASAQGWLNAATIFIFLGCTGKSAQVPLLTWLPDAMAGPTPVSALIHAATMVTSGIFLLARMSDVFVLTPGTMQVIVVIALITAIWAAITALFQWDIKKVLAYSTVSQLGFMFMAAGTGQFDVALFHVITHAFFKATLFLGAGSVIHSLHHEQDMRKMGGLQKAMPLTYGAMFLAWWAIIGLPLGSGFFSKDLILERALFAGNGGPFVYTLGLFAALLTAIYMTRLMYLTFWSPSRADHPESVKEVPWVMSTPVMILGIGSFAIGCLWIELIDLSWFAPIYDEPTGLTFLHDWLSPVVGQAQHFFAHSFEQQPVVADPGSLKVWGLALVSAAIATIGFFVARARFGQGPDDAEVKPLSEGVTRWTRAFDIAYDYALVKPIYGLGCLFSHAIDRLLDAVLNVFAWLIHTVGTGYQGIQRGSIRWSLVMSVSGVVVIIAILLAGGVIESPATAGVE